MCVFQLFYWLDLGAQNCSCLTCLRLLDLTDPLTDTKFSFLICYRKIIPKYLCFCVFQLSPVLQFKFHLFNLFTVSVSSLIPLQFKWNNFLLYWHPFFLCLWFLLNLLLTLLSLPIIQTVSLVLFLVIWALQRMLLKKSWSSSSYIFAFRTSFLQFLLLMFGETREGTKVELKLSLQSIFPMS